MAYLCDTPPLPLSVCTYAAEVECSSVEWACASKSQCIPVEQRCDGALQCFDFSDEADCRTSFIHLVVAVSGTFSSRI